MIGALMTYGALTAKTKALYGKRLRTADFEHMAALGSETDVLEYLRTQPGGGPSGGEPGELHRPD